MSLAMTRQEREAFLADVHVGIIHTRFQPLHGSGQAAVGVPSRRDYHIVTVRLVEGNSRPAWRTPGVVMRRNGPQKFIDGAQITVGHLAIDGPGHHLQDRRVWWAALPILEIDGSLLLHTQPRSMTLLLAVSLRRRWWSPTRYRAGLTVAVAIHRPSRLAGSPLPLHSRRATSAA
jgi:hypothetical protein